MAAAIPDLDAVLEAPGVVIIRGLHQWLGIPDRQDEPEDAIEALCRQLSGEA